jgi:quercetin dioxygenase-like cupin family protein
VAHEGDVIENPRRGERVTMLGTAGDGDASLRMRIEQDPTTATPPLHLHPRSTERLAVEAGTLSYRFGKDAPRKAQAGEVVVVDPGVAHTWWNDGPDRLVMTAELDPAGRFETFLETIYGLTRDGRVGANGRPSLLQAAVVFREFRRDFELATVPRPVQRLVFPLLALIGRARGLRAAYPEYSDLRGSGAESTRR